MTKSIVQIVLGIENDKKSRKIAPFHANLIEIVEKSGQSHTEVQKALNLAVKSKILYWGKTLNSTYFTTQKLIENDNTDNTTVIEQP